jgi:hypothetical protein
MDLTSYVTTLRQELAAAARSAGPEAEALAERLTTPLEAATRLVLQEAVADAAQEISRDLAPGSVDVRLRGRDLGFVVDRGPRDVDLMPPPALPTGPPAPAAPEGPQDADTGTARLTVRLPELLKTQLEGAAEREGLSVNAYLVRTLTATVQPGRGPTPPATGATGAANRLSGWVQ